MPVVYDGKALIPAPLCSVELGRAQSGGGRPVGAVQQIVLRGKLTADKGSPDASGVFWTGSGYPPDVPLGDDDKLAALLRKQEALETLFSADGRSLEVSPWNGAPPRTWRPRVRGVAYSEGPWVDTCDYTVTMEADADVDPDGVQDASEAWSVEQADDRGVSFRVSHSCSATGRRAYDETGAVAAEGWERARRYVLDRLGLGMVEARMHASGVLDAGGLVGYNHVRSQQLDEMAGSFSATETWLAYDPQGKPPAIEEYTTTVRVDQRRRTTVSVEGQIQGLEERHAETRAVTRTRYQNALDYWLDHAQPDLLERAQAATAGSLNESYVSTTVGSNQLTGVITYSIEFDDRPVPVVAGAISESVRVSAQNQADVYASVPVLGRPAGPVLQALGSKTARRKTVVIEAVLPAKTVSSSTPAPSTDAYVASLAPVGSQVFVDSDQEEWDEWDGRYSRQVSFVWQ